MLKKPFIIALVITGLTILFSSLILPIKIFFGENSLIFSLVAFIVFIIPTFLTGYIYTREYKEEFTKKLRIQISWYYTSIITVNYIIYLYSKNFGDLKTSILTGFVIWWLTYLILGISSKYTLQEINKPYIPITNIILKNKKKILIWLIILVSFPVILNQITSYLSKVDYLEQSSTFIIITIISAILLLIMPLLIIIFAYKKNFQNKKGSY